MRKTISQGKASSIISMLVFISLLLSIIYTITKLVAAPTVAPPDASTDKVKSDYVLMLVQCVLGIVVWSLPSLLNRRMNITLPNSFLTMYFLFLYCAIYLGEVRNFYYAVPHWDTVLHTFSGAMLGALGFSAVLLLNDTRCDKFHLSPLFVALFAFCFAVTLGAIWEIYEFTLDSIMDLNMQKAFLEDRTPLVGREALMDTMKDIIVDMAGAGIMSTVGYALMKKRPGWLYHFDVRPQGARQAIGDKQTAVEKEA